MHLIQSQIRKKWDVKPMKKEEIEKLEKEEFIVENAKIDGTNLGYEHNGHGILSCYISLDYGGSGQSYGGYSMDGHNKSNPDLNNREPLKFGSAIIMKIVQVFKRDWENLIGIPIRVLKRNRHSGPIIAIGHYLEDNWVYIKDLVREFITKPKTLQDLREQHQIIGEKIEKLAKTTNIKELLESMALEEEDENNSKKS